MCLAASECDSAGQLNIARRRHREPSPEGTAGNVGVEIAQPVIVPDVEGLRSKLEAYALCDANVLGEREIVVLVAESAKVRDARAAPVISSREAGARFEGREVEERLARIEIALALREGILAWQRAGDATDRELNRNIVAVARLEGQWGP